MATKEELQQKWIEAFHAYQESSEELERLNAELSGDPSSDELVRYLFNAVTILIHNDTRILDMLVTQAQAMDLLPHDDDLGGPPDLRLV